MPQYKFREGSFRLFGEDSIGARATAEGASPQIQEIQKKLSSGDLPQEAHGLTPRNLVKAEPITLLEPRRTASVSKAKR